MTSTTQLKDKPFIARFRADILWMLEPFVHYGRTLEDTRKSKLIVEPCAVGGCMIIAVNSHGMAIFRDPEGSCSTSAAINIPCDAFPACEPNRSINLKYCNNSYDVPLPSWAQPDEVWVYDSGMFVMTKMRHPDWADQDHEFQPVLFQRTAMPEGIRDLDHDYFVESEIGLNWRKPLSRLEQQRPIKVELISINPSVLSLYERIHGRTTEQRQKGTLFHVTILGDDENRCDGLLLEIDETPDFFGVCMPMRGPSALAKIPDWATKRVHDALGERQ